LNATIQSLPVLVLYPHSRCNCRCVMCDIWKETTKQELSVEELVSHLEDIERLQVQWVVFSGGEPLMHTDLFRLADMLRSRNIRLTILSSGLLLKRHAEKISANIDDLIVSLDGPPAVHDHIRGIPGGFAQLKQGVHAIHERNPKLPISARFTVQKSNHCFIEETAVVAKDLGLNSISFLAADLTSHAFNRPETLPETRQSQLALTFEETVALENQFAALHKTWQDTGFVRESAEKLSRIVRHFRAHLELCDPVAPLCNAPWVSAVVEADGTVRPCFFQPPIGSVKNQTLFQVLNGFEALAFRSSLDIATNHTCKRCVCSLQLR
jgi:MoaA/NifB/PqqE/SkfB family radical SAM enzyme